MSWNIVGTCSECGGPVSTPAYMINPVPRCANCGATMANPYGPKIPMEPRRKPVSPGKE